MEPVTSRDIREIQAHLAADCKWRGEKRTLCISGEANITDLGPVMHLALTERQIKILLEGRSKAGKLLATLERYAATLETIARSGDVLSRRMACEALNGKR